MEYQTLAGSELRISKVGFGACAIGGYDYGPVNDAESIGTVEAALDLGVNFFDTADVYGFGHSETILGKALGSRIKDVVVATKFGVVWDENGRIWRDCSPSRMRQSLEASLKRLATDCIPLYQLHWLDGVTPLAEVVDTLARFRTEGKILYAGLCNVSQELAGEGLSNQDILTVQLPFSVGNRSHESWMQSLTSEKYISTLAYNVLGRGVFSGKFQNNQCQFNGTDTRHKDVHFTGQNHVQMQRLAEVLGDIGRTHGVTPAQMAIRWVLDHDCVSAALIGIKRVEQLVENISVFGWKLSVEELTEINGVFEKESV